MVTIFKSVFKSDLTSSSPVKIKMQLLLEKKKKKPWKLTNLQKLNVCQILNKMKATKNTQNQTH